MPKSRFYYEKKRRERNSGFEFKNKVQNNESSEG